MRGVVRSSKMPYRGTIHRFLGPDMTPNFQDRFLLGTRTARASPRKWARTQRLVAEK